MNHIISSYPPTSMTTIATKANIAINKKRTRIQSVRSMILLVQDHEQQLRASNYNHRETTASEVAGLRRTSNSSTHTMAAKMCSNLLPRHRSRAIAINSKRSRTSSADSDSGFGGGGGGGNHHRIDDKTTTTNTTTTTMPTSAATAAVATSAAETKELYDYATWRMYNRIVDHRRRKSSHLHLYQQPPAAAVAAAAAAVVAKTAAPVLSSSEEATSTTSSDAVTVVASTTDAGTVASSRRNNNKNSSTPGGRLTTSIEMLQDRYPRLPSTNTTVQQHKYHHHQHQQQKGQERRFLHCHVPSTTDYYYSDAESDRDDAQEDDIFDLEL